MELPRGALLEVSEELGKAELAALKFLSREHVPRGRLEAARSPHELFEALRECGALEAGNMGLLRELLYRIGRIDLLAAHLGSGREQVERELRESRPGQARVAPYSYLLFQLSEDVTKDELMSFKFHLDGALPRSKLTPETTMLDIFIEMEKKGLLGKDNLGMLKSLCEKVNISLWNRMEDGLNLFGQEEMITAAERGSTEGPEGGPALPVAPEFPGSHNESSQLEAYKMSSRPRGVCLILNNHNFARAREGVLQLGCLRDRNGTDVDAAALRNVFSKLHFRVEEYRDLTAEEIRKTVNIFRCEDHKNKDCFVCCILSHGKKGIVYGVDGQEVPIRELTTSFTAQNCHSLAGKPKVFFIQACQGDALQKAVTIEADAGEQDASAERDRRFQQECIPAEADFLLGMATLQDYVSYRSPREGTWYIQALCQHLESRCPRGDSVVSILTAVNREVSRKTGRWNAEKQMPQPIMTLQKRLIFPVN
ncbi:caspase-8-like isoform X2 [Pithys albifrons albifrons]|uniref:caspase-8-like isoform X2 n=1 Tax=Pithys albifrons albifrons TaxID=3385563 RepID=UPI003A5CEBDE